MKAACPACGVDQPLQEVEVHVDPIAGGRYRIGRCGACGVVSSEPRQAVGADWYEKAAPIRAMEGAPDPAKDWRFGQFFRDCPPGRILDVGCGEGGFLTLARGRGFDGVGFDYDERVVRRARESGVEAYAAEFEGFCGSRAPREFDAATFFDSLEHHPEPAWMLARVKRLLKPGAVVAVTLPNALRPLPWGREEHDYPPHHFTRWTPDAMKGFLERQGFSVIRQDAGSLRTRYLADHFFFYRVMPPALAMARRLLFGAKAASSGETVTALYGKSGGGALFDKRRRQRIVDLARAGFNAGFWPAAACLKAYYRMREPRCGDCLYTAARLA